MFLYLFVCAVGQVQAQTQINPTAQPLPYSQNFSTLAAASTTYPAGWQGWQVGTASTNAFATAPATASLNLTASSSAATNSGGVHNYNGTVGLLSTNTTDAAICLALVTTGRTNIVVNYDMMTIRNPYDGGVNKRFNQVTLQYRVGVNGTFTTVGTTYQNNTTTQTSSVTTPQNLLARTVTLPAACDDKAVIQLRWVQRDVSGSGARPSFAVDNISVDGCATIADAGGPYSTLSNTPVAVSATASGAGSWSGGLGSFGNAASSNTTYTPALAEVGTTISITWTTADPDGGGPCIAVSSTTTINSIDPITAAMYAGGIGRGDVSVRFQNTPLVSSIYSGGDGRGDVSVRFQNTPLVSSIYSGGDGRGDVSASFQNPPMASSIFSGGDGRGDVSASFQNTLLASSIFSGGDGRGDVAVRFSSAPTLLPLSVKMMLQGPYDVNTGLMNDALRTAGLLPTAEPYTGLGYSFIGGGGEITSPSVLAASGTNAIVDWVVVELRDGSDASSVLDSRCGLLQRDGDVVAMNGVTPLTFGETSGAYFIAVRQRNHLGIMTGSPITLGFSTTVLDLASAATATYGVEARKSITGTNPTQALWAGDVNFDGSIKYTGTANDRDPILHALGGEEPTNTLTGYLPWDVNMDGTVKYTGTGNDREPILMNLGADPVAVRVQQIP